MIDVEFTSHLKRHVEADAVQIDPSSLQELTLVMLFKSLFQQVPEIKNYVVNEQGELRKHVVVFIDNNQIQDRKRLSDPIGPSSKIFILQALSGG